MDFLLIDVVIGLLLIYVAMSFLLTKVQESFHGGVLRGRVKNMHLMLDEAVGHDQTLKEEVLKNPLLFALSSGTKVACRSSFGRPTGPSSIPPDLFAKALLVSLNQPSGKLPSSEALPPLAFMDHLIKNTSPTSARLNYLEGLRALVPSPDSGWPAFETAIATWFSDIGDRADGWYKRRSSEMGLMLALFLCATLNIDTGNIINRLGGDRELRQGFGQIAEGLLQQRVPQDSTAAKASPPTVPADPATQAISRLVDANNFVTEAFNKDKAITRFGFYVSDHEKVCKNIDVKPSAASARDEGKFVSNSDTWVSVMPALLPKIELAIHQIKQSENDDPEKILAEAYQCLSHVSAWVRAASTASSNIETRRVMVEAGKALEDSKAGLLAVMRSDAGQGGFRQLFRIDPEAFQQCANEVTSRSAMSSCVLQELDLTGRLPVGHTASNRRVQFCKVITPNWDPSTSVVRPTPVSVSASSATSLTINVIQPSPLEHETLRGLQGNTSSLDTFICGGASVQENPRLKSKAMQLKVDTWLFIPWLIGIGISALFISLGAPILFDLLGHWVKLRYAGRVRDANANAEKGGGTLALPMLASPSNPNASNTVSRAGTVSGLPEVEGAQPGFEERLTAREVQALRQRLNVKSEGAGFDDALRSAIRAANSGDDRLTLASYFQLMGRPPVQAGQLVGALPTTRPQRRQPFALASSLAAKLNQQLDFSNRVPTTETAFSDELRALAVLYRYKKDTNKSPSAPVFSIVENQPQQLDQIDEALLNEILSDTGSPKPRFPNAPWMDIALGELGQVESKGATRATSNPRVCDYLDACVKGLGDKGDDTPWCAAFVTWVLKHPFARLPGANSITPVTAGWADAGNGLLIPAVNPALAASWKSWQRPPGGVISAPAAAGGTPIPVVGDVVVVSTGSGKFHTGFVFAVDSAAGVFWMLGGNQFNGSRVSLSRFNLSSIA